jgi:hypothetical protein
VNVLFHLGPFCLVSEFGHNEGDMELLLPQEIKTDREKEHVVKDMHHDRVEDGTRSRTNPAGEETKQEHVWHNDRIAVHRGK